MGQPEFEATGASKSKPFALLDASFLLALADEVDGIRIGLMTILDKSKIGILVSPTVSRQLHQTRLISDDDGLKDLAVRALCSFGEWIVLGWGLSDPEIIEREELVGVLHSKGVLDGSDIEATRILAEAAVIGCEYLITDRPYFLQANQEELNAILSEQEYKPVKLQSPADPWEV